MARLNIRRVVPQQSELSARLSDGHRTRQRVRERILPEDRRAAQQGRQTHAAAAQEDRTEKNDRLEKLQVDRQRDQQSGTYSVRQ